MCSHCGLVSLDKTPEPRAEWRNFGFEKEERVRTGSPTSLAYHDMGLSTVIGRTNSDSSGHRLNASMQSTIHRLRTWDSRIRANNSADRNLLYAFTELRRLKDKLGLSDAMLEKTAYIYRKAQEKQLIKGRSTSSMLAAAIYIACRELGASRTLRDVTEITGVKRKSISRDYRLLITSLEIKIPPADPMKCIAKIANKINISERTRRSAMKTMNDLVEREISAGKGPMGLAATILYISCLDAGESVTQKTIAEAAGITDMTIRNRLRDLKAQLPLN